MGGFVLQNGTGAAASPPAAGKWKRHWKEERWCVCCSASAHDEDEDEDEEMQIDEEEEETEAYSAFVKAVEWPAGAACGRGSAVHVLYTAAKEHGACACACAWACACACA